MSRIYSLILLEKDREDLLIGLSFQFSEITEFIEFFFILEKKPEDFEGVRRSIKTFRNQERLVSDGPAEHRDFLAKIERKLNIQDEALISGIKREMKILSVR